ncbi:p47 [Orgyia leucostigma nucleopolyhedrovirus]|uniref:p47 n=1 Tax=Orgyia leucostigma nucleopolyhedrovirus TaxID=490711 RepID=B0FDS0_9ABAC|nr:p47 [Orgyia leucostigma nucleopolyhedrovirus]ABY65778.1 p47 [Orgyia leucostigma nucleopolyhedrovirus]
MVFARYYHTQTQWLPQCCRYLADELSLFHVFLQNGDCNGPAHVINHCLRVNDEGFLQISRKYVVFDVNNLGNDNTTIDHINDYIDITRPSLSAHDMRLFKLLARSLYYKSDYNRLKKILTQENIDALIAFACNVMWERGYENHYTLGQQLSIRITTKFIQSGLDFKHQTGRDEQCAVSRGWNNIVLEKFLSSITSLSDVIKRHRCCKKFILLELAPNVADKIKLRLRQEFTVIDNERVANMCAIEVDADKNSDMYLKKLTHLMREKIVNLLFATDVDFYMKHNNYKFYFYNSLKLYYYCLTNKLVFYKSDYEIIFYLYFIIVLEWYNGGHLNSFTLEKSPIYNPLELSTRRLNSIKRAAAQSRTLLNDNEIKIDFIKGKRMKTGTHYGHRIITTL